MRIFLVEPYYGGSHRAWADGYARSSSHDVFLLTLPARFWKWRMRGAALTLAEEAAALVQEVGPPQLILASDMLDLPSFLGLARSFTGNPGVVLYMHENQISYPPPAGSSADHSYGFTNWLSACAADLVLFNSRFHLDEFFGRLPDLLGSLPDFVHTPALPSVRARSEVMPVGVDLARLQARRESDGPPVVLWNQRWEYDKDPVAFFEALELLDEEGFEFHLVIAGESFRQVPPEFPAARDRLAGHVVHYGYASDDDYVSLLARADVVVSTARQDFFGVGVVEAVAAGAFPVLPARLNYPDLIPAAFHDVCFYRERDELLDRLRWVLRARQEVRDLAARLAPVMRPYDWSVVTPAYDERFAAVVRARA